MSLFTALCLDLCLRKAFLWFFLIMGTLFLNILSKTMPGQQALLFISVIEGIYLASFTFRVIQKYRIGSELLVYTVLISFIEMITLCVLLLRPTQITQITEAEVTYILELSVISLILYVVGSKLSLNLFKRYLFKNVMPLRIRAQWLAAVFVFIQKVIVICGILQLKRISLRNERMQ